MTLPLSGLRVLDFTTFLSGPYASQLLGDLGAEIIKVEPREGDSSRGIPSHEVGGMTGYFLANNRNKKSIGINLKEEEGRRIAVELALKSDVVLENFRPGVAARLGLDAKALTKQKPELIWASISGFGQTGPWRDRPAYDMIVQALSGVMSMTGEPGGNAVRLGIPMGDIAAGLFAVIAILSAREGLKTTGHGQVIDVAMLDGMLNLLSYQGVYSLISGRPPGPQGARHDSIPTYRSFRAGDGREFVITANTDRMWQGLCKALEREDLLNDPRFSNGRSRLTNREALWAELESGFQSRGAAEWIDILVANDVPAALINNVSEALDAARDAQRGMIVPIGEGARRFDALDTPIRMAGIEAWPRTYPPRIGENNHEILADILGHDPVDIRALEQSGVLHCEPAGT